MRHYARRIEIANNDGRNYIRVSLRGRIPLVLYEAQELRPPQLARVDLIQAVLSRTSLKAVVEHSERVPQENVASAL